MSSDLKINCPICNQEFPTYDQRGFRNAGFTAHHKRCFERHQQSTQPQQCDQQTSRASRFAWAVRRRLLPARPTTSSNLVIEGQNRSSPQPPVSGSSSSSSPQNQADIAIPMTPIVPSQVAHPKQHIYPRQRHTWNHWNPRRRSRRSAINVDTTTPITTSPSTNVPTTTVMSALPDPRIVRPYSSLPVMDSVTDSPTFPLLTAITTLDSATALIIPQTASPHLSNQTPATSPMMSGSDSPFSFTSMLTTLPVESVTLLPSTTISTCSSSNNSNINANDRNSIDVGYPQQRPLQQQQQQQQQQPTMPPPDGMFGQYHHHYPVVAIEDGSLYHQQSHLPDHIIHHHHHHQVLYGSLQPNIVPLLSATYYHSETSPLFSSPTSSSPPNILPRSLRSTGNPIGSDDEPIHECGYCQPRNGQHDPTCSLMQFIMMNILGGRDDPSSSSR